MGKVKIDSNKFLGKLCKHGHKYKGTGKSLRYDRNGKNCVICEAGHQKAYRDRMKTLWARGEKFVGPLCPSNHDYKGTGESLRYGSSGRCVECIKVLYTKKLAKVKNGDLLPGTKNKFLGPLCKLKHDYNNTEKSLMSVSTRHCIECRRIWGISYREKNKVQLDKRRREYIKNNRKKYLKIKHKSYKRNITKIKADNKALLKKYISTMSDNYIRRLIVQGTDMKQVDITQAAVEIKRCALKLHRSVKEAEGR